jgi:hypothetical protein
VGRPTEARRLAAEATDRAEGALDLLFAGMPRSMIWPSDAADAGLPADTLFEGVSPRQPEESRTQTAAPPVAAAPPEERPTGPGLWDTTEPVVAEPPRLPTAESELDAGRAAIAAGDLASAAVHLAVALRLSSALAPAILDAAASAPVGHSVAALELVRGDAYRAVGHESDARRAFAAAAVLTGNGSRRGRAVEPAEAPVAAMDQEEETS